MSANDALIDKGGTPIAKLYNIHKNYTSHDDIDKLIELIMYADSYHDFRNAACSNKLHNIVPRHYFEDFRYKLDSTFNDVTININTIEDSTINYIKTKYPTVLQSNAYFTNIIKVFNLDGNSNLNEADIEGTNYIEMKINDSIYDNPNDLSPTGILLLKFLFGSFRDRIPYYFSFDAGSAKPIERIFRTLGNVKQLVTPQNVLDSATLSINVFNDNSRLEYLHGIFPNSSNYFTKDHILFNIDTTNPSFGQDGSLEFDYNAIYSRSTYNIPTGNAEGPGVNILSDIMTNCKKSDKACFDRNNTVRYINYYNIVDALPNDDTMYKLLFDIKRMGDHEQANAVYYNNKMGNNTVFVTIDKLAALYSQFIGNPTILVNYAKKTIIFYKGKLNKSIKDLEKEKKLNQKYTIKYILEILPKLFMIKNDNLFNQINNNISSNNDNINKFIDKMIKDNELLKVFFNNMIQYKLQDISQLASNINTHIINIISNNNTSFNIPLLSSQINNALKSNTDIDHNIKNIFTEEFINSIKTVNNILSNININYDNATNKYIYDTIIFDISNNTLVNNNTFNFNFNIIYKLFSNINKLYTLKSSRISARARDKSTKIITLSLLLIQLRKISEVIQQIPLNNSGRWINTVFELCSQFNSDIRSYPLIEKNNIDDLDKILKSIEETIRVSINKKRQYKLSVIINYFIKFINKAYKILNFSTEPFNLFENINYLGLQYFQYKLLRDIDEGLQEYINMFIDIDVQIIEYIKEFINSITPTSYKITQEDIYKINNTFAGKKRKRNNMTGSGKNNIANNYININNIINNKIDNNKQNNIKNNRRNNTTNTTSNIYTNTESNIYTNITNVDNDFINIINYDIEYRLAFIKYSENIENKETSILSMITISPPNIINKQINMNNVKRIVESINNIYNTVITLFKKRNSNKLIIKTFYPSKLYKTYKQNVNNQLYPVITRKYTRKSQLNPPRTRKYTRKSQLNPPRTRQYTHMTKLHPLTRKNKKGKYIYYNGY